MMPFTRRINPEHARFLFSTCRAVAFVAGIFCVAVSTLLIGSYAQLATVKPLDNPALTRLRERYHSEQEDEALAADIRALDLMARRAFFTRQWQVRTGGWMLAAGAAVLLACLRAMASLARRLPQPKPLPELDVAPPARGLRWGLAGAGALVLAAAFASAFLGSREPSPAAQAEAEARPQVEAEAEAGPELTTTEEFRKSWPQFRGPGGTGIAAMQRAPLDWDGPTGRNVLWKAEVPLPGFGSPVVWNGRVFLSGADARAREVYCWDAATGKLLWRSAVESTAPGRPTRIAESTGYAAPTMAVNGSAAFAMFATGDLVSLDLEGRLLWTRNLGPLELNYGYASSPALYGSTVIIQVDQEEGGRIMALDAATGRTRWEKARRVTASWASPIVVDTGGRTEIIVSSNPVLASFDARTGRQLWEIEGMMGEIAPSPAYAGGRVFAANQLLNLIAVDVRAKQKLWETYDNFPDVSSPLAAGELLFMAASYGVVSCLEAASGAVLWTQELKTGFYASPILAGDRVYLLDRSGVMRIFSAAREAKLLGSPAIGEPTDATPAFWSGRIFIRGDRHLFCIGAADD